MISASLISLICGVIMCIIGIAGFVANVISRAKGEGQLLAKIDYALQGIDEIKLDMKDSKENLNRQALKLQQHDEQIKSIFKKIEML
ncbi:MAG: hypothetical protein RR436_03210 [Clostridia bacterium]